MNISPDKVQLFVDGIEMKPLSTTSFSVMPLEIEDYSFVKIENAPFDLEMELKRELGELYEVGASREELKEKANEIIRAYNESHS
jgi:hypothetical protein